MGVKVSIFRGLGAASLLLAMAGTQALAGTTYYRWLDDRGNPVHSDRPPPKGIDYEVVSTGGDFKRVVPAETGAVPKETEPTVTNNFQKKPVKPEAYIKKNPEICERARENLTTLESYDEVRVKDDNGDTKVLTAEEKDGRIKEAMRQISLHCE